MAELPLVPISSLKTPWDAEGKTIRGRVITKSAKRTYDVNGVEDTMFCFTFSDGTAEIEVVAFGNQVKKRFDTIVLNENYAISKFTTHDPMEPGYSLTPNKFSLNLMEDTEIVQIEEQFGDTARLDYSNIQQIDKLEKLKDGDAANVIGVCKKVEKLETRSTTFSGRPVDFREIYLIDTSGVSVKVALWAYEAAGFDLEIGKIVYLYGARKNTFNGEIELRTVMNTMMLCEGRDLPEDIPGLQELKDWWQRNKLKLTSSDIIV